MQELKACCAMVQEINAAGIRKQKKRNASRRSSDDARTRDRPRSELIVVAVGDGWEDDVLFTGLKAGGVVLACDPYGCVVYLSSLWRLRRMR
jgi:hypothetical protein